MNPQREAVEALLKDLLAASDRYRCPHVAEGMGVCSTFLSETSWCPGCVIVAALPVLEAMAERVEANSVEISSRETALSRELLTLRSALAASEQRVEELEKEVKERTLTAAQWKEAGLDLGADFNAMKREAAEKVDRLEHQLLWWGECRPGCAFNDTNITTDCDCRWVETRSALAAAQRSEGEK